MIPKIIHQIWMQGWSELPLKFKENVESVARQNAEWKVMTWDESSLRDAVASLGQPYLDKYDGFKLLHQRVDFGRYALLYIYGGASVDTDIFAFKGFDETPNLDSSDLIISKNSTDKFYNNATILSSKNNPIILGLLDETKSECSIKEKFLCIQETTGPDAFTKYMNKHKDQITVLDNSYFEPCSGADKGCEIPDNSILDHRHELSWLSPSQVKLATAYHGAKRNQTEIIAIILLLVVIIAIIAV